MVLSALVSPIFYSTCKYIYFFYLFICSVIFYSFEEFLIRISHLLIFTLIFIRIYIKYYSDETSLKWDRVTTGLLTALPTRRPELESLSLSLSFIYFQCLSNSFNILMKRVFTFPSNLFIYLFFGFC